MATPKPRHLLALAVIAAEFALHPGHWWVGIAAAAAVLLRHRDATAAFVAALALSALAPGGAYVLLLWAAYQAGREVTSRLGVVVIAGASAGALAAQLARTFDAKFVATFLIFVVLPLLAGRYTAQHERLVATLASNERLRIARDMHDSLGHRLSLVSIQAAALEVGDLPPAHREAVSQLARSARDALDELYLLVGGLRGREVALPGLDAVDRLVAEYRDAGVDVTVDGNGTPQPLPDLTGHAAYRVVEECLTNAAKHAPGQPVRLGLTWEPDALLLSVANPVPPNEKIGAGHGLDGLEERVGHAGGLLDHRVAAGEFRLVAMFPAAAKTSRTKAFAIGVAVAVLMFVFLPATMMIGVSR